MEEPFSLAGKTAVVTGGAGLVGTAVCEGLAKYSATVIVADVAAERGREVADELDGDARFVEVNTNDEDSVVSMIDAVLSEHGRIDVLVNCSYPRNENYGQPYDEMTIEDWRENVDLHLNSYFLTAYAVSRVMTEQASGGSIINFGSTYGAQAPDFSVYEGTDMTSPVEYSAIKGAVLNLTRYLASYLGAEGIRVNAISPGGVFDEQDPVFVKQYEKRTPLKRMAEPSDFKGPVVFLSSDASAYVTGHNLRVDGGWTIC